MNFSWIDATISERRFDITQGKRTMGMRLPFRFRFAGLLLLASLAAAPVGASSPTPVGVWLHATGRIEVEIAPCTDRLCGKLVWFKWPNDAQGWPLVDLQNPDPKLRKRPLLGLTILTGLRPAGDGTWEDGTDLQSGRRHNL